MIGVIGGTVAGWRSLERACRLVSLICALVFLIGGIAHVDHVVAAKSVTVSVAAIDVDDGGDEFGKSDRLLIKTCHYCSLAALPTAIMQFGLGQCVSVLPLGRAGFLNPHSPGAELPPPKLSA